MKPNQNKQRQDKNETVPKNWNKEANDSNGLKKKKSKRKEAACDEQNKPEKEAATQGMLLKQAPEMTAEANENGMRTNAVPDVSMLPEDFVSGMRELLGEPAASAFFACYKKNAQVFRGLRFNRKKARPETIAALKQAWDLKPVPWCADGFYYDEKGGAVRPGKSPYHDAGVFYIQEPSAMLPAEAAEIKPDELVLDLCAAPGGKSTQAAARAGLLLSNEIIPKRAKLLSSAIERLGFSNVIVTSAAPQQLAEACPALFDKILVDAPCSGEGMMRREAAAIREWSVENVALCARRQQEILEDAAKMLRPGGRLVYSTCTFEPYENRWQVQHFLSLHPEFHLLHMQQLMPHEEKGEGHFCAVMEREGTGMAFFQKAEKNAFKPGKTDRKEYINSSEKAEAEARAVSKEQLEKELETLAKRLSRARIHVLRQGVQRGETKIGVHEKTARYIPSHAEVIAEAGETAKNRVNLKTEALALRYLSGESLDLTKEAETSYEVQGETGFCAVCFDGYPMGLGKRSGLQVKNHYPKGLRRTS